MYNTSSSPRPVRRRRGAGVAALVAMAALAGAPSSLAVPTPDRPVASVPEVTNASAATVSWLPVAPETEGNSVRYEVDVNGTATSVGAALSHTLDPLPEGSLSISVRAVEVDPGGADVAAGDLSPALALLVDRAGPSVTPVPPPPSESGWYRGPVTVAFACDDASSGGSGIVSCSDPVTLTRDGADQSVPASAVDAAGNRTERMVGDFDIDATPPAPPAPSSPEITNESSPTLRWRAATDATSGVAAYVVTLGDGTEIPLPPGTTALRVPITLPDGVHRWSVRATDVARNESAASAAAFEIDTTVPAPPSVTGPPELTRDRSPALAWEGLPGARFTWVARRAGGAAPVAGQELTEALAGTLPALADGDYLFSLRQTNRAGTASPEATLAFTVDGTAPEAPTVTERPPASAADATPSFGWRAAEPGGAFQWQVMRGGEALDPPTRTESREVRVGPLAPGGYAFRVRQVDAAGNIGAFADAESFSVVAPAAGDGGAVPPAAAGGAPGATPRPRETTTGGGRTVLRPPSENAALLTPRAGIGFRALGPRLTWRGRPAGTTLYNVQIFRMRGRALVKVHSAFPRAGAYRVPRGVLKAGQTYVWRVWPYLGRRGYAKRPIGISWFRTRAAVTPRRTTS